MARDRVAPGRDRAAPGRDLIVDRVLYRDGNLVVEVTRKPDSFERAISITRTRRDGTRKSFTLFPRELDDIIEALADGADLLVGPE